MARGNKQEEEGEEEDEEEEEENEEATDEEEEEDEEKEDEAGAYKTVEDETEAGAAEAESKTSGFGSTELGFCLRQELRVLGCGGDSSARMSLTVAQSAGDQKEVNTSQRAGKVRSPSL